MGGPRWPWIPTAPATCAASWKISTKGSRSPAAPPPSPAPSGTGLRSRVDQCQIGAESYRRAWAGGGVAGIAEGVACTDFGAVPVSPRQHRVPAPDQAWFHLPVGRGRDRQLQLVQLRPVERTPLIAARKPRGGRGTGRHGTAEPQVEPQGAGRSTARHGRRSPVSDGTGPVPKRGRMCSKGTKVRRPRGDGAGSCARQGRRRRSRRVRVTVVVHRSAHPDPRRFLWRSRSPPAM